MPRKAVGGGVGGILVLVARLGRVWSLEFGTVCMVAVRVGPGGVVSFVFVVGGCCRG